jgi:uncharacterized heparinase superfamily protein
MKLFLYFNTIKFLKLDQVRYRLIYRFKKPKAAIVIKELSNFSWRWCGPSVYKQSLFNDNNVIFLSLERSINSAECWNTPQMSKLWLYNLHYFDDLNSSTYLSREQVHFDFIERWIEQNPACIGNGWEPYPISLRLVNWVKWFSKQGDIEQKYLSCMLQQAQALSQQIEYHILGNHLFANAKALTFVGCFISNGQAEKYLELGLKLLDREIPEQFLADGGHFELSPMYHEILLWDLLELIDLAVTSQNDKLLKRLPYWRKVATQALAWLKTMIHPDGEVSFFNDSAIGIAATPTQVFEYARSLKLDLIDNLPNLITHKESGYSRISTPLYSLIIDHANVGPDYLPGHAHADTLSFELSVGTERVFVNSGTSLYGVSKERLRQRKTAAHNTVVVDDEDSSEVWSGFRVARRAYSKLLEVSQNADEIFLEAQHDGYKRLKGKVIHTRAFTAGENKVQIKDQLSGQVSQACAFFHIHPDVQVQPIDDKTVRLITKDKVEVLVNCHCNIQILNSTYHPKFGISINNKRLKMDLVENQLNTVVSISEEK